MRRAEKILTQTMMFYLFFNDLRYILHRSELGWTEIFKKFAQDSERFAQLFFLQSNCRIYNQIVDFFEPTIVEIYNEIVEKKSLSSIIFLQSIKCNPGNGILQQNRLRN